MSSDIPYSEIVERLNSMAETIAADCIPNGKREGQYWRGDCHGKCSVHISGSRTGMCGFWQGQRPDSSGGNLIHLIEIAMGLDSHGEAVRFAKKKYLGIGDREMTDEEKRKWAASKREAERKAKERQRKEDQERERRSRDVQHIWKGAVPISGTPAEAYLTGRGIDPDRQGHYAWPPSLRYHRGLTLGKERHPALIGAVQSVDRAIIGVWRIFLTPEGKALTDAEGKKLKLGLGPASGGAVRLGPVGERLIVAEGIETALAVQRLTGHPGVFSCLSTSGMSGLVIPPQVKTLEIYADGDRYRPTETGIRKPPGILAAEKLAERAGKAGIEAKVFPSPEPDDWLDVYTSTRGQK